MTAEPLHLAIAFDRNYEQPLYALLASIFDNNKNTPLRFHLIATGFRDSELKNIQQYIAKQNCSVIFYPVDESVTRRFVTRNSWTDAVYYRLFFPLFVAEDVKRLLYLDTDTLVLNELTDLYQQSLDGFPVGAVYDNYVVQNENIGITAPGEYFNSGVLLIDVPRWREQKISEKAIEYLHAYPERISYVDQDALNAVLKGNWKKLADKFNMIYSKLPASSSMKQLQKFIADTVVLHFTLERPWHARCRNRLRSLYFKYLSLSPAPEKSYPRPEFNELRDWIKLRLIEFYLDSRLLKKLRRLGRSGISG